MAGPRSLWVLLLLLFSSDAVAEVTPEEILHEIIESRRGLSSWKIQMKVTPEAAPETFRDIVYYSNFDSKRLDLRHRGHFYSTGDGEYAPPKSDDGVHTRKVVHHQGASIDFTPDVTPDGRQLAVRISPMDDKSPGGKLFFDPRVVGLVPLPFGLLYSSDIESFEAWAGKLQELEVSREGDALVLSGTQSKYSKYQLWCEPGNGFRVVKVAIESTFPQGTRLTQSVELAFSRTQNLHPWFPESLLFSETRDGVVIDREYWEVASFDPNPNLSDDVFELKSLAVPKGMSVVDFRKRSLSSWTWDGEKLVETVPSSVATVPSGGKRQWYVYAIAAFNLVFGAIFIWYYFRRKGRRGGDRTPS